MRAPVRKDKGKDKPYRDYSDDSWFTALINGLRNSSSCCWIPVAFSLVAILLAGWLLHVAL